MDAQFSAIAPFYDALMSSIPYARWVEYVRRMAASRNHPMRRVLDVGCGTGTASLRLASSGVTVVGIDASADMVDMARRKTKGPNPRYAVARMEELDLGETFDTAISLFDSVNYVTEPAHLQEAFHRINQHLDPGGLWMFDMNTPYALEMELFTQDNLGTGEEPQYNWRSDYDARTRMTTVDMSFFVKQGDTRVVVKETHHQRAYTLDQVRAMLTVAGFDVLGVYDAYTERPPGPQADRAFFITRRAG